MSERRGAGAAATIPSPGDAAGVGQVLGESIRGYFREDRSRMTMMAARRFQVPERVVLDSLTGDWPVVRLREGVFRELMDELPGLGLARVFVRSRAAVIESVGTFGGYSDAGPFFNVQTDTLDMHILHAEIASVYSVVKDGHDAAGVTHSFQFFDHVGDAAFKVYLWENFPDVPAARVEAFQGLTLRFRAEDVEPVTREAGDDAKLSAEPLPEPELPPAERRPIPTPEGVVPGTSRVGAKILGAEAGVAPAPKKQRTPRGPRALRHATRVVMGVATLAVLTWVVGWFIVPLFWVHYEHHIKLEDAPKFALTAENTPSDPLNVGLFGAESELVTALLAAGWSPADPDSFQVGLKAAREALKDSPYPKATLDDMFLLGQHQDLVFEKLRGKAGGKHVVRLWKSKELGLGNRPLWLGTAVLERPAAAGAAPTSTSPGAPAKGKVRIAADRDAERDGLINDLTRALRVTEIFQVTGVGPTVSGENAAGERYFTDGELVVGTLSDGTYDRPPTQLASPWPVRLKDQIFGEIRAALANE